MHQLRKLFQLDQSALIAALGAVVWSVVLASWATPSFAATERDRGIRFAQEGRCEAALEIFQAMDSARRASDGDALVERLTGECALRTQQFRLAAEALGRARALSPTAPSVDLNLAIAHFHQGDVNAAAEALARAPETDRDRPEFLLYSGLIALEDDAFERAARSLGEASRLKESAPEPMASFFLGRALSELDRLDEADAAFDRVIEEFDGTSWAAQASEAKNRAHEASDVAWQFWGALELGFEHDDNVILKGQDVPLPEQISDEADQRGFWFVDAGALATLNEDWRLGGLLRYSGTGHVDLSTFNANAPGATVWLDRILTKAGATLRLQYDLDGTWVNEDPFLVRHLATTSYFHPWAKRGHTVVSVAFGHSQYYYPRFQVPDSSPDGSTCVAGPGGVVPGACGPFGLDERSRINRTGNGLTGSVFHRLPIDWSNPVAKDLFISGEYTYHRYWARGAEYDRHLNQLEIELGGTLPLEIAMTVGGRYGYSLYDNNSVFRARVSGSPSDDPIGPYTLPSRRRREQEVGAWVRFERALTDQVGLAVYYRYTDNASNTEVFDYERNVVGMSLRVALGG